MKLFKSTKIVAILLLFSSKALPAELTAEVKVNPVGDFNAKIEHFQVNIVQSKGSFKTEKFIIPWSKLKTGMALRDKHALEYVNASEHPNIEVMSSLGRDGKGAAKVKFNGKENIVKGTYVIKDGMMTVEFPISLKEFDVKKINFKGAGVEDTVNVKITVPIQMDVPVQK